MGLNSSNRETPTATYAELQAFRVKAVEISLPSLARAAPIGWERWQREIPRTHGGTRRHQDGAHRWAYCAAIGQA
jgi:hypothetical protein